MKLQRGKFIITRSDKAADTITLAQEGLVLGRAPTCHVELNHLTVSRIHAGINRVEKEFYLVNLSVSNTLMLNGRVLNAEEADVLADGDVIQIGVFAIFVNRADDSLSLNVTQQYITGFSTRNLPKVGEIVEDKEASEAVKGVLSVFWTARSRDEDEAVRNPLRPRGKPQPGKAQINWKPTHDLRKPWNSAIFSWALIILGGLSFAAFYVYPNFYSPAPISNPHVRGNFLHASTDAIANRANNNSCTTCHTVDNNVEAACIKCHQTDAFHGNNIPQHAAAGISCTACHAEHKGADFEPRRAAFATCAECHNDNNKNLYNGKSVHTPHGGTWGYVAENGKWTWTGMRPETLETMPAVAKLSDKATDENARRSVQFHALHMARINLSGDLKGDSNNTVSCSTCHKSFSPLDRETPRQTCGACHTGYTDPNTKQTLVAADTANCVSCHVQHHYDKTRWDDNLTAKAQAERVETVARQIQSLAGKQP